MKAVACLALVGHLMWLGVDTLFATRASFPTLSAVTFPLTFVGSMLLFYASALVPRSAKRRRSYR